MKYGNECDCKYLFKHGFMITVVSDYNDYFLKMQQTTYTIWLYGYDNLRLSSKEKDEFGRNISNYETPQKVDFNLKCPHENLVLTMEQMNDLLYICNKLEGTKEMVHSYLDEIWKKSLLDNYLDNSQEKLVIRRI